MEKKKKRLIFFTGSSILWNVIVALYKISLVITSHSILILLYAFYNISLVITHTSFIRRLKSESEKYYIVGWIVIASSISYMIYSARILFGDSSNTYYNLYSAIGIAAVTFFDLVMSIIGIRNARKNMNIEEETSKLINLATSLISVSVTQSAVLSFMQHEKISLYMGIGGIIFGTLAMIVGIYMIFYIKKHTNEKS